MFLPGRVAIFIFFALSEVLAFRYKIEIPRDEAEEFYHRLTKREDPCKVELVQNPDATKLPDIIDDGDRPWVKNKNTKISTSVEVTNGIKKLYGFKVPGLDGAKISEVVEYFASKGGLSFPYGGWVRDQFLAKIPADLDMESNCDADKLEAACKGKWKAEQCPRYPNSPIMHVGVDGADDGETDIIDASVWDETFFGDGTKLEYTTNSVSFFAGNLNIIIDITGNGVDDTCNKKIQIPVSLQNRDKWMSYTKVFRYWKLRVKEYTEKDKSTGDYIKGKAKTMLMNKPELFKKLYCHYALGGKWGGNQVKKCTIKDCPGMNKTDFDKVFSADLAKDNVWTEKGLPVINKLECDSCPNAETCKKTVM